MFIDPWMIPPVIFKMKFQRWRQQFIPFRYSQSPGHASRRNVSDNDFHWDGFRLLDDRLPVTDFLYIMSWDSTLFYDLQHAVGHPVVDNAFILDVSFFLSVTGSDVVFVIDDQQIRIVCLEDLLCLSLIPQVSFLHDETPLFLDISRLTPSRYYHMKEETARKDSLQFLCYPLSFKRSVSGGITPRFNLV